MQTATAWLKLNELGDNVQKKNITPSEALLLRAKFGYLIEGETAPLNPLTHLALTEDVERGNAEEYGRLCHKYGAPVVKELFPGVNPKMPVTFEEVGFEESEEPEPKKGVPNTFVDLKKLPRDNGADLVTGTERRLADLEQENMKLRLAKLESENSAKPTAPVVVPPVTGAGPDSEDEDED